MNDPSPKAVDLRLRLWRFFGAASHIRTNAPTDFFNYVLEASTNYFLSPTRRKRRAGYTSAEQTNERTTNIKTTNQKRSDERTRTDTLDERGRSYYVQGRRNQQKEGKINKLGRSTLDEHCWTDTAGRSKTDTDRQIKAEKSNERKSKDWIWNPSLGPLVGPRDTPGKSCVT